MEGNGGELRFGRYRALRRIKQGLGIETWFGEESTSGERVVIKAALGAAAFQSVEQRLEKEASILRDVRASATAPLLDVGRREGRLYIVMAYVEGEPLDARLAHGPLDVQEAVTVGRCLMRALVEMHEHGILHRDLKPANVIVDEQSPLTRATLIDFGLARSAWLDSPGANQTVGTVRYMSPEQAGLLDVPVDERADLYSAGVILYEAIAGHPPFRAEGLTDLLRQQLGSRPPALTTAERAVPRALDEVIARLLRKDPSDRYQSARGVLADLVSIATSLERGEEPSLVLGLRDPRYVLSEPDFVGREAQLALLEEEAMRAVHGVGTVFRLEAESGGGKSRLLDELAHRAKQRGLVLFRGQGQAQVAGRPFCVISGVAEDLVTLGRESPELLRAAEYELGHRRDAVLAALPELRQVLGSASESAGPEAFGEARTIDALCTLFLGLGTAARPALILLDDCQWADEATLKFLLRLQRILERGGRNAHFVQVVVAYRSEEVPAAHLLRRLGGGALTLPALDASQLRDLVQSMAGAMPDEAIEVVRRLSNGSPFMASAVLRGLCESGALVRDGGGWRIEPLALEDLRSSNRAAVFLAKRLELLPEAAVNLLSAGAVLGKEFLLHEAAELAGVDEREAVAVIEEAQRRHILWRGAQGAPVAFVHDKLRETLLAELETGRRRGLHQRTAERLTRDAPERVFDIAYHFDAAGLPELAFDWAVDAAERAREQHALEVAEQQYLIAERGLRPNAVDERRRIVEGLGEILMLRGRYDEASERLSAALPLAPDDRARARVEGKLGDLAFKRGDMGTAAGWLERALASLGRPVPRSRVVMAAMLVVQVVVQVLHSAFPTATTGRARPEGHQADFLAMRLYSRLAHVYWFQRGSVPCAWAHLVGMNLAERFPPSSELAQAYSEHAPVMTMLPWFGRGIDYARRSLEIRRSLGDVWGEGQSNHFFGVVLYAASRYRECIERCQEAVRLLSRTGDHWELDTARWHIAFAQYRLGDMRGAVETSQRVHQEAIDIGDGTSSGISLGVWGKASLGRAPAALLMTELRRETEDIHTGAELAQAEALRLIHVDGRPSEAVQVLTRAKDRVEAAGLRQEYVSPLWPWLATAIRCELESTPTLAVAARARLLAKQKHAVKKALAVARRYANNLPHALREQAFYLAARGKERPARAALASSIEVARAQSAAHEIAQSELALAILARDEAAATRARSALRALDVGDDVPRRNQVPATMSLVERFDRILESGRTLATALTRIDVLRTMRAALVELLRAERCVILGGAAQNAVVFPADEQDFQVSQSAVAEAREKGRPILFGEGWSEGDEESVVLARVRSGLCAPVYVRQKLEYCVILTHAQLGRVFGEAELQIAQFIATLAGAALENADGFSAVQALSAERTRLYQEASDAVRARDEFLSIASHELKTPLTSLKLQLESALRTLCADPGLAPASAGGATASAPSQRVATRLESANRQVLRLTQLINRLLDISVITSGRTALSVQAVDLVSLVREAVERLVDDALRAETTVRISAAADVVGLWDRDRLDQVVTNLVSNALKYGGGKPVEVTVSAEDGHALLQVEDHGIGIAKDAQARIFERFERAVSSSHYGGFGLGLWIVRQIVDSLGGSIDVTSTLGVGTTFRVHLPLTKPPLDGDHEKPGARA